MNPSVAVDALQMEANRREHEIVRGLTRRDGVEGHHGWRRLAANVTRLLPHMLRLDFEGEFGGIDQVLAPLARHPRQQWPDSNMGLTDLAFHGNRNGDSDLYTG